MGTKGSKASAGSGKANAKKDKAGHDDATDAKKAGNSAKDSRYLKTIKNNIENLPLHPRNRGVRMQAHHVISGEGMARSKKGSIVESHGYDINHRKNVAFIPCTLQGACYLGIQVHRGNHSATSYAKAGGKDTKDQDDYRDKGEPRDYHDKVSEDVKGLIRKAKSKCTGDDERESAKVIKALNGLSLFILRRIQYDPDEYPLSSIAENFGPGGKGCGGVESVVGYGAVAVACPVGRNHRLDEVGVRKGKKTEYRPSYVADKQVNENIKFDKVGQYELRFEDERKISG